MSELQRLNAIAEQAWEASQIVQREVSDYRIQRQREFDRILDDEVGERFGARLLEVTRDLNKAMKSRDDEKDRLARTGAGAPFPVGTKMVEWESRRWAGGWAMAEGRGLVEVITRDSVHPANMTYGRASIGAAVIRILSKSGKPTARYIRGPILGEGFGNWHPEGVDPNEIKEETA